MNEKEAWQIFSASGSVLDYLNFKSVQKTQQKEQKEYHTKDEIYHQRTCDQTTEYR